MTRPAPGYVTARSIAFAVAALIVAACAPPASAQQADSVWDPSAYGVNGLAQPAPAPVGSVGTTGQGGTPLPVVPSAQQCTKPPAITAQTDCRLPDGAWGFGIKTTTWSNGCGSPYTTQDLCEVACKPVRTQIGGNGACQPDNGSYGQGSYLQRFTDGCGTTTNERQRCCVPGRVPIGGASACRPYNGAYWSGSVAQLYTDGCGGSHYEYQTCCVPQLYEVYRTGCGASNGSYGAGIMQIAYFDGCGGGKQIEVPCGTPVPCVDFDRPDCHDSAHQ